MPATGLSAGLPSVTTSSVGSVATTTRGGAARLRAVVAPHVLVLLLLLGLGLRGELRDVGRRAADRAPRARAGSTPRTTTSSRPRGSTSRSACRSRRGATCSRRPSRARPRPRGRRARRRSERRTDGSSAKTIFGGSCLRPSALLFSRWATFTFSRSAVVREDEIPLRDLGLEVVREFLLALRRDRGEPHAVHLHVAGRRRGGCRGRPRPAP